MILFYIDTQKFRLICIRIWVIKKYCLENLRNGGVNMAAINELLDNLEDYIESAKSLPFSSKISVEKETILDIISEMRLNLPNEIRQAQRIISDYDKIIKEANDKAKNIIINSEKQCERLVNDHEVYKKALEKANELLEEAKENARDARSNAMRYADEMLAKTETILKEAMIAFDKETRNIDDHFSNLINVLYKNRKELKGEEID